MLKMKNVAVIGAAGRMGRWLCKFLSNEGFNILANDIDPIGLADLRSLNPNIKPCSLAKCVLRSEVVILSVPINSFESVVKELKPYVRDDHLIIDICSIKKLPVEIMHRFLDKGIKLGTHPLFGPGSHSIEKKKIVLTPITNEELTISSQIVEWLEEKGGYGIIMDPAEHDKIMSTIMGVSHAMGLILVKYLSNFDLNILELLGTPTYNFMVKYSTAILSGNLDLYIQLQKYLKVGEELKKLIKIIDDFIKGVEGNPSKVLEEFIEVYKELTNRGVDIRRSYDYMYKLYEEL